MEMWIDRSYVPAGYGWSFPAGGELRIGVGSFDPRFHVREPTERLAARPRRRARPLPGQLDPARAPAGDRGRRVLRRRLGRPLPAPDRRGHPDRAVLRARVRARAGSRCWRACRPVSKRWRDTTRSRPRTPRPFRWMLRVQRLIPRVAPGGAGRRPARDRAQALPRLGVRPLPARSLTRDFVAGREPPADVRRGHRLRVERPVAPAVGRAQHDPVGPVRRYLCVTARLGRCSCRRRTTGR